MRLLSQFGAEPPRKPTVLIWRLPKRPPVPYPTAPQNPNLKKPGPVFGRRPASKMP